MFFTKKVTILGITHPILGVGRAEKTKQPTKKRGAKYLSSINILLVKLSRNEKKIPRFSIFQ